MKTKILILSIAAILPATSICTHAAAGGPKPPQRDGENKQGPRDGERKQGPRDGEPPRPPMPMPIPFLRPLDTDEDGIISADEIKNAPDSLKKLDKNQDGKLTREEWQPPMPPRPPQKDGERKPGPRDGERPQGERPRDGERPRGERQREGDSKGTEKKTSDWPFGNKDKKSPEGEEKKDQNQEKQDKGQQDQNEHRQGPPPPPLLEALDTDRDGTISEDEISKSSESLAKLDHNMDGQLGPREYGPRPPQGPPQPDGDKKDGEKPQDKPAEK
jgi:hypothetical protein